LLTARVGRPFDLIQIDRALGAPARNVRAEMATVLAITASKWHDLAVNISLSGLTRPRLRGAIFLRVPGVRRRHALTPQAEHPEVPH
jgi:hypothetical protein